MTDMTRTTTDARPGTASAPARSSEPTAAQGCCGGGETGRTFLPVRNATREIAVVDERRDRD